jgi:DNA-binding NarL/FixJ family response regulator
MKTTTVQGGSPEGEKLIEDVAGKLRDLAREFARVLDRLRVLGAAPEEPCPSLGVEVEGCRYVLTRFPTQGIAKLTPREQQVAELAAQGLPCKSIAKRLGTSKSTAAAHIRHIFSKLDVHSRGELAWHVLGTDPRHD